METRRKMKLSTSDKVLLGFGYAVLGIFVFAILIPLVYVVVASFMDPNVLNSQGISFKFKDWTLDAYRRVLENEMIWRGFLNSFFYSTAFTVISVFVTLLAAYPMSKKEFVGRKFLILFLSSPCFWRRYDTYIYSGESAPYGKYSLGDFASGSIQCMEYDFGENVLSVYSKRTSRSVCY